MKGTMKKATAQSTAPSVPVSKGSKEPGIKAPPPLLPKLDEEGPVKFVIPKILLEDTGPPPDSSARVTNDQRYEMLSLRDLAGPGSGGGSGRGAGVGDGPRRAANELNQPPSRTGRRSRRRHSRSRGRGNSRSEYSPKSGGRSQELREIASRPELSDPPCCPRMCLLVLLWLVSAILLVLMLAFVMKTNLRTITMMEYDQGSCFVKVRLTDNTNATLKP